MSFAYRYGFTSYFPIWMPFLSFSALADTFRDDLGSSLREEGENWWPLGIRNHISMLFSISILNYFIFCPMVKPWLLNRDFTSFYLTIKNTSRKRVHYLPPPPPPAPASPGSSYYTAHPYREVHCMFLFSLNLEFN